LQEVERGLWRRERERERELREEERALWGWEREPARARAGVVGTGARGGESPGAEWADEGPRAASPGDAIARDATAGNAAAGDATARDAAAGDATAGDATVGDATAGDATAGDATADDALPETATSGLSVTSLRGQMVWQLQASFPSGAVPHEGAPGVCPGWKSGYPLGPGVQLQLRGCPMAWGGPIERHPDLGRELVGASLATCLPHPTHLPCSTSW